MVSCMLVPPLKSPTRTCAWSPRLTPHGIRDPGTRCAERHLPTQACVRARLPAGREPRTTRSALSPSPAVTPTRVRSLSYRPARDALVEDTRTPLAGCWQRLRRTLNLTCQARAQCWRMARPRRRDTKGHVLVASLSCISHILREFEHLMCLGTIYTKPSEINLFSTEL